MYCTVREIPYLNKIEKEIHKVIHEKGRIRWTQLKKIICDDKKICSERIFREKLNGMVERNLVFKLELGKTNVVYSTESSLMKSSKLIDFCSFGSSCNIPIFLPSLRYR